MLFSREAEEGVKPRIWAWAVASKKEKKVIVAQRERVMGGCDCTSGL